MCKYVSYYLGTDDRSRAVCICVCVICRCSSYTTRASHIIHSNIYGVSRTFIRTYTRNIITIMASVNSVYSLKNVTQYANNILRRYYFFFPRVYTHILYSYYTYIIMYLLHIRVYILHDFGVRRQCCRYAYSVEYNIRYTTGAAPNVRI